MKLGTWNPRHRRAYTPAVRRAYTLVEMLIVVSIMISLIAITLPVAKKVMDGSQGREASRQLNAYLAMAKARALQTGRPCGLYFPLTQPLGGPANPSTSGWTAAQFSSYWPVRQATQVFLAEVPAPYSGSVTNAVGRIDLTTNQLKLFTTSNLSDTTEAQYLRSLLNLNEQFIVRFNYKGDWYVCNYDGTNFNYVPLASKPVQPFSGTAGVPFQILRTPRPIGNALELPQGVCVDMTFSGVGNTERRFPSSPQAPIANGLAVMFSPNGAIDSIYVNGFQSTPAGSLYFLIGKVEKVPTIPIATTAALTTVGVFDDSNQSNLADPASLWVVISRSTGQVLTAENLPNPALASVSFNSYILACRQAAIQGEQMTGR